MIYDSIILGAGAAGFFAAISAGERKRNVLVLEKNNKTGAKILMSGGTRCNLTQNTDVKGIVAAFGKQGRFLYPALAELGPQDVVRWFNQHGVETKVESTGKIFPVSNRAIDVRNALLMRVTEMDNVDLRASNPAESVERENGIFHVKSGKQDFRAKTVVVCTGGKSYPGCGTVGDGYRWTRQLGHTIVSPIPALTPIVLSEHWVKELQGVTLPDALVGVFESDQTARISDRNFQKLALGHYRGGLLFTHFGISGPTALNVSKQVACRPNDSLKIVIDFLPDRNRVDLEEELNASDVQKKLPRTLVQKWLPLAIATSLINKAGLDDSKNLAETGKPEKLRLVRLLKSCEIAIEGTRGFKKAEVTSGGVSLKEVNSQTMESKICEGLFLAGEVLDLDGPIGGFNFQSAFSTGYLAGKNV